MGEQSRALNKSGAEEQGREETVARLVSELLKNGAVDAKQKTFAKNDRENAIDLLALFWHLLSKWVYIAAAAILSTLLAVAYLLYVYVPVYSATAKLYIIADTDSVINLSALQVGTQLSDDYLEVFKTWEVHEMVRSELGVDYTYGQLRSMISVSNSSSSRVIYITATHSDPEMASAIANAYSKAAKTFISSVMKTDEPSSFSMALVPGTPSGTSRSRILMMGFLLGTVLAMGIIVLQFLLDDHPKTPEDITAISTLPVLGVTPTYVASDRRVYGGSHESRRD